MLKGRKLEGEVEGEGEGIASEAGERGGRGGQNWNWALCTEGSRTFLIYFNKGALTRRTHYYRVFFNILNTLLFLSETRAETSKDRVRAWQIWLVRVEVRLPDALCTAFACVATLIIVCCCCCLQAPPGQRSPSNRLTPCRPHGPCTSHGELSLS